MCHDASAKAGVTLKSAIDAYPSSVGGFGPLTREILGMIGWPIVNQTGFNENAVLIIEDQFAVDFGTSGAARVGVAGLLLLSLFAFL